MAKYFKEEYHLSSNKYYEKVGLNFFLYKGGLKDIPTSGNFEVYLEIKEDSLLVWLTERILTAGQPSKELSFQRVNIPWKNIDNVMVETNIGFFSISNYLIIDYRDDKNKKYKAKFYSGPEAEKVRLGEVLPRYNATLANQVLVKILQKIKNYKEENEDKKETDPLKILKIRYAKGEITKEEFEQMKKDLEG